MNGKTHELVNLTPHHIVETSTGTIIPPSGIVCRIDIQHNIVNRVNNIPIYENKVSSDITGLPEPKEGVIYIVSGIVKQHIKDRKDVLQVGKTIKNNGHIIGCVGFVK